MAPSKKISLIVWVAILSLGSIAFAAKGRKVNIPVRHSDNKGFAVVELFTSEGCSSCPPADEVVEKIQKEINGRPVYILAYHVDYWNRLGWKDQFSSAVFSQRQNRYAHWLNLSGVYTPQAVVNGTTEFVGSEEGTLRTAIKTGLQRSAASKLVIGITGESHGAVSVSYHTEGALAGKSLVVALVQKSAVSKVLRGENSGRTLSHVQIVRDLQSIGLNGKNDGSLTVNVPQGLSYKGLEVIAFLQDDNSGEITAASETGLTIASIAVVANNKQGTQNK